MQKPKINLHTIHIFLLLITVSKADIPTNNFCGKFQIKPPFINPNSSSSSSSSPLNNMILCKSQKPYFRTSIGLFPISSINYTSKTLIISHPVSSSSTQNYISPSALSSGFPDPPSPNQYTNSLLLFNCSKKPQPTSDFLKPCTGLCLFGSDYEIKEVKIVSCYHKSSSCLFIEDVEKLGDDMDFHPKDLNCSHYRRVHRSRYLGEGDYGNNEVKLGTRMSFDVPDHVPDLCKECEKPNGNCGVGLRCICHAKECSK